MAKILQGLLLAAAVSARAAGPAPAPPAAAPEVKASTAAPTSVTQIYTADRLRDPFTKPAAASLKVVGRAFTSADFNIHGLSLTAIMKDAGSDYALFSDNTFGVSFILRKGKLYDEKAKRVGGVAGSMDMKRKTVRLVASDGDVQIFRLGEGEAGKE